MAESVLMKAPAAAAYIGETESALRTMVQRRQIPFVRTGKRSIRFDRRQLDRWITERTVEAAS